MEKFGIDISTSRNWRKCHDCRNRSSKGGIHQCFADIFGNRKCFLLSNTNSFEEDICPFYKVDKDFDLTKYPVIDEDDD